MRHRRHGHAVGAAWGRARGCVCGQYFLRLINATPLRQKHEPAEGGGGGGRYKKAACDRGGIISTPIAEAEASIPHLAAVGCRL
jgi:hypothetical protein